MQLLKNPRGYCSPALQSFDKSVNQINIIYNNIYIMHRYKILKSYYNHDMTIGLGSYGEVKLATNLKTGDIVAIKIVRLIKFR